MDDLDRCLFVDERFFVRESVRVGEDEVEDERNEWAAEEERGGDKGC